MKQQVCWILKEEQKLFLRSKKIKEENNLTVLSITHDIDEAANAQPSDGDASRGTLSGKVHRQKSFPQARN
jgi:ABC-type thiamine transport system ATPase subunit